VIIDKVIIKVVQNWLVGVGFKIRVNDHGYFVMGYNGKITIWIEDGCVDIWGYSSSRIWCRVGRVHYSDPDLFVKIEELLNAIET